MQTIFIKHLTGSKANQTEQFSTNSIRELTIGRDGSSQVRFDPERDDLVGRNHARILRDPVDPNGFQLMDMQSRNGTFLNRQRVYGTVALNHLDIVQLGAGGPEFRFEVDPPPASGSRPTREASSDSFADVHSKPTREWSGESVTAPTMTSPALSTTPRPVGRATVERMLGDVFGKVRQDSNRAAWWVGTTVVLAVLLVGGGIWYYQQKSNMVMREEQEQTLASIRRMNDELKKNPRALNSMKKEMEQLMAKVNKLDPAVQSAVKGSLNELQARSAETQAAAGAPANAAAAAAKPAAPPTPAAAAIDPTLANATYDQLMDQATDRFQHGKTVAALDLVKFAIARDPSKWEGYEFAGQLEEKIEDFPTAVSFFEQALQKAPADARQDIQYKLDALRQKEARK